MLSGVRVAPAISEEVRAMTTIAVEVESPEEDVGRLWWVWLLTGILWIIIGFWVLAADYDSALLIGYLVAFWLIFAGITEFLALGIAPGWKWLHATLGVLFVLGGIGALLSPFQTFTILAALIGFFLILKGTFDFVLAIAERRIFDLWWLTLIAGILQVLLGFWAVGYPGRSAVLLIIWIGFGALFRGVSDIVLAFGVHHDSREVAA
jgi:uncharacterized membrane protein HdeD (DUF308 family)